MWSVSRIQGPVLVVLLAGPILGCCEDCEDLACPDTVPPMAVTDLRAATVIDSAVTLVWTAPGDDGDQGVAAQYDVRHSTEEYSGAGWWDTVAVAVVVSAEPRATGSAESLLVHGLLPHTTFFFALKTADEVPNWSGLSNVISVDLGSLPSAPGLVQVTAGIFIMGDGISNCGWDEHDVTLTRDFFLGQHEVTNQEYLEAVQWAYDQGYVWASPNSVWDNLDGSAKELLNLGDEHSEIQFDGAGTFYLRESPSDWAQSTYPSGYDPSNHPAKQVTWYGAARYCDWLSMIQNLPRAYEHSGDWSCNGGDPYAAEGYRLPTDAEWEYAARFPDGRFYPWGSESPDCSRANYQQCSSWTVPVGTYPVAPEALGLSEMAGNVGEWCNDWWACELGSGPQVDPSGPTGGSSNVVRPGSWYDGPSYLRCALRVNYSTDRGFHHIGFRVARTVAP